MGLFDRIRKVITPKPKPVKQIRPTNRPTPPPPKPKPTVPPAGPKDVTPRPPASKPVRVNEKGVPLRRAPDRSTFDDDFQRITRNWTENQWTVWKSFAGRSEDPDLAQDFYDGYIDPNPYGGKARRVQARKQMKRRLVNEYGFSSATFSNEFDWEAWKMENEGSPRDV